MSEKGQTTVKVVMRKLEDLRPYAGNPRQNDNAVAAVAESIRQFGWQQPIVVDKDDIIVVGHTRFKAAQRLGLKTVPVIKAENLTEEEARAYRLADNRLAELAQWDFEKLGEELDKLDSFEFDSFGFDFSFMEYDEKLDDNLAEYYEADGGTEESRNSRLFWQFESDDGVSLYAQKEQLCADDGKVRKREKGPVQGRIRLVEEIGGHDNGDDITAAG